MSEAQSQDILDPNKSFDGLTYRQFTYAHARANGATQTEAYKEAYSTEGWDRLSIGVKASEIEQNVKIRAKIRELTNARLQLTTLVPLLNRNFVLEGIMQLATKEAAKDNVRLRAYELLGRVVGVDLFKDTQIVEAKPRTPEDVDRELKQRLNDMMQTIDGEAKRVEPTEPVQPAAGKRPALKPAAQPGTGRDRRRKPAS